MANVDAAFGARPVGANGGPYTGRVSIYYSNVADALYIGDIVALGGSADAEGVPDVIACTPSLIPVGIIVGMLPSASIPETQLYKKSGDAVYFLVADDPNLRFHIQANSDAAIAATDIGQAMDLEFTEGSTITGRSKMELDQSTLAASSALHAQVERLAPIAGNELGLHAVLECSFKQHAFKGSYAGT